jgi:hypothetical protein
MAIRDGKGNRARTGTLTPEESITQRVERLENDLVRHVRGQPQQDDPAETMWRVPQRVPEFRV